MRVDELRAELDRAAGPEQPPIDAVQDFLGRQATLRSRRRWGVAGISVALAIAAVAGVLVSRPPASPRSVEIPAGPTTTTTVVARTDIPVAHLELASPILTAGTTVSAVVVVENTGQEVTVVGCGSPFGTLLGSAHYEQTLLWSTCFERFTLSPGESRFPVSILVTYTECSWNGNPGPVPCPPVGPGYPDMPPLPDGAYRLTIESTTGDKVELPPPRSVHVTKNQCGTTGDQVTVPDVRGDSYGDASHRIARQGLTVVRLGSAPTSSAGRNASVVAQQPLPGTRVPKGSCVGLRTR